jgi:hypothetical protein
LRYCAPFHKATHTLHPHHTAQQRLKSENVAELPYQICVEIIASLCRVLELTDVALVVPTVEQMTKLCTTVPNMQKFIRDVTGIVCQITGKEYQDASSALENVVPALRAYEFSRIALPLPVS